MIQPLSHEDFARVPTAAERPQPSAAFADRARGDKTTLNTDAADREIRQLKEKQRQLEQQLRAEQDETKRTELQNELKTVNSMLSFKDNDAYRREHAVVI